MIFVQGEVRVGGLRDMGRQSRLISQRHIIKMLSLMINEMSLSQRDHLWSETKLSVGKTSWQSAISF